ncbi:MAG: hypothetical protein LBH25_12725 [Fibromonadaceae bacterium]|jgi:uncharacterized protein (TIGR02145 family)|nr:hypothetical protein [Fibromonadaceae bacterium]
MKLILKNLSLLLLLAGASLPAVSCSGSDGSNGINGANGADGTKGNKGDKGTDGTGCDFGEDGEYYVMLCGETEKARWAKAYCDEVPYNPAEMGCDINNGILFFYFTDMRDGKEYKALILGRQIWMAENLSYNAGSSKCYNNDTRNCEKYGRLYNWETAISACPEGWRLPSREDWAELVFFADSENGSGADELGFAVTAGGLHSDGLFDDPNALSYLKELYSGGAFLGSGDYGFWWNATVVENDKSKAYIRSIDYGKTSFEIALGNKTNLLSVRCVKD